MAAVSVAVAACGSGGSTRSRVAAAPATTPGCSTTVAPQARLKGVRTAFLSTAGTPFRIVTAPNGGWSFLATSGSGIGVLSGRDFVPRVVHTVPLPGDAAVGDAITRDGRYVLAADDVGAVVVDAERAEQGRDGAVLGRLRAPNGGAGAIEVATSADGRFAFVTLEGAGRMAVFNLAAAVAGHFRASEFIGSVPLGLAPVGMALSPNGRWLYSTSEGGAGPGGRDGSLKVIDVRTAESDPAHAVVSTAVAGCGAVRVVVSADGRTVWVTARALQPLRRSGRTRGAHGGQHRRGGGGPAGRRRVAARRSVPARGVVGAGEPHVAGEQLHLGPARGRRHGGAALSS